MERRDTLIRLALSVSLSFVGMGCSCASPPADHDAAVADAAPDAGSDAAGDASGDAGSDAAVDAAVDAWSSPDTGPRAHVAARGELSFAGCTPPVSAVHVRLRPSGPMFDPTGGGVAPAPATPITATVATTSDPRVLTFRVDDLLEGDLYQVGVDVDGSACGEIGWRGPRSGFVMAGNAPVRFDALVRSTHLEVLAARPGGDQWVSRDFVRSDAMMRHFRWSTDLAGVANLELQFATDRFAIDALDAATACAPPAGLIHTRRVVHSAIAPNVADIDLAAVLAAPPVTADPLVRARWDQVRHRRAPLYVRAVPHTATDDLCDPVLFGVSSWVELVVADPGEMPPMIGGAPTRITGGYGSGNGPWPEPQQGAICYRVVTPNTLPYLGSFPFPGTHDAMSWAIVGTGFHPSGYTMLPGESFCWWPPSGGDSSFLDDLAEGFSNFVTGLVDAISQAVDAIAALYEAIKGIAVDIVTYALAHLTGCPSWCHALVQIAAEYALVAMGLPPSLPNFDELADMGVDYLAAEVAAQTGVPAEVITNAYAIASDMMARAEANRGGTSGVISWAVEDTGFRPSYVVLDVARGWSLGTPTNQLFVSGSGGWNPTLVALHTPATGQPAIRMVVVLYPDYTGIPAPAPLIPAIPPFIDAYYGHPERVQSYYQLLWTIGFVTHTCVSIRADAVQLDFPSPPVFVQPYADLTLAGPGPFDDPFTHACTP